MKKKRRWCCAHCGSFCEVYKKGKNHRVVVCPKHGIILNNPLPFLALGASLLPSVMEGAKSLFSKEEKPTLSPSAQFIKAPSDKYTTEERVRDALR